MTTLRLFLAGFLVACGLVALTPAASQACSCAYGNPQQFAEMADVVFTGSLMQMEPPPRRPVMSSTDPNTYTFTVNRVLQGDADSFEVVQSAMSGASCGLEGMQVGRQYVVFATYDGEGLESGLCSGTQLANPALVDQVASITGADRPAVPDLSGLVAALLAIVAFLS